MCHSPTAIRFRAVLVLVLIGFASSMGALANRVFVSARSGNDSNSCDNIATPCQTFAGVVGQLNPGGEAIVLDSGGYGAVTITKSLTIEAPPGVLAFIHPSSGDAITINAGASDTVVLRGLVLNGGSGGGILVNTVGTLVVEDCAISGFFLDGIAMIGAGTLNVKNTDVAGCRFGVSISNSSGRVAASIDHCHLDKNTAGFVAVPASPGSSVATVTNSTANGNSQRGWISGGSTGSGVLNLEYCAGSGNGAEGVVGHSNSAVRYSNCVISNNGGVGVAQFFTGTVESRTDNSITGNVMGPSSGVIGSYPAK